MEKILPQPTGRKDRCGTCVAYEDEDTTKTGGNGTCRENPPQVNLVTITVRHPISHQAQQGQQALSTWPTVPVDGWCRKWSPKIQLQ
jgi:hypothetical protein